MGQALPSGVITLPNWMKTVKRRYITRSGGQYRPEDVALAFALSLRLHDSANELRALARRLVDKVCLEHQPNLKRLGREPDDAKVFEVALRIINRVCDLMGYGPGYQFVRNEVDHANRPAGPVRAAHPSGAGDGSDANGHQGRAGGAHRPPAGQV